MEVRETVHGATLAAWADHGGHRDIADLIVVRSNDVLDVTFHGHLQRLQELLARDRAALAARVRHGHGALHVGPNRGDAAELVRFLISNGAPLDAKSEWGETALARFLRTGADDLADLLIEAGASE